MGRWSSSIYMHGCAPPCRRRQGLTGIAQARPDPVDRQVDAALLLGVDMMTGHWDFTYGQDRVQQVVNGDFKGRIEFLAQNIRTADFGDAVFKPYALREINGVPVAIIGQAFPYTPIANPRYFVPDWSFGIREDELQKVVDEVRAKGAQLVVLLSHNGMDVDLKLASRVTGLDAILGGHTHDRVPVPVRVAKRNGHTWVTNAGCNGKFLGVFDFQIKARKWACGESICCGSLGRNEIRGFGNYTSEFRPPPSERLIRSA